MHTVHHTDAVILKSVPAGEANRRVWLFTKEFGLVVATIQGVRKQGSKLQMNLIEYSFVSIDMVKGKDTWRLISLALLSQPLEKKVNDPLARSYVRTLAAVERFCQGEERNDELYNHLVSCSNSLNGEFDPLSLDTVSIWKVLVLLGYCPVEPNHKWLVTTSLQEAVQKIDTATRDILIATTNKTIRETHL